MSGSFWQTLPRPVLVLAPMAGVTDAAFRRIWAKYGKPDVTLTEFVSCDGLCSSGREHLLHDLWYSPEERPIVAQIFSGNPDNVARTAELVRELGFDGIDINAGCPDKTVEKQGAGAMLTRSPGLLHRLVLAAQRASGLPVSVKTRLGYERIDIHDWIGHVLEAEPAALTIHARTRDEMSKVPAHWEIMGELVAYIRGLGSRVPLLGNGDVASRAEALRRAAETGLDGVMIGRGVYGNPWFFNPRVDGTAVPWRERLGVMLEHSRLYVDLFRERKNFLAMRKHYKAYVHGFVGAKELRMQLVECRDLAHAEELIAAFLASHGEPPLAPPS